MSTNNEMFLTDCKDRFEGGNRSENYKEMASTIASGPVLKQASSATCSRVATTVGRHAC